jgi:hypothetical protein
MTPAGRRSTGTGARRATPLRPPNGPNVKQERIQRQRRPARRPDYDDERPWWEELPARPGPDPAPERTDHDND